MNNRKNIEINRFDFGAASRGRRFSCKLADQKNHGQKQKSRQATKKSQKKRGLSLFGVGGSVRW